MAGHSLGLVLQKHSNAEVGTGKKISRWRINILTGLGWTLRLRSQQEGSGGECEICRGKAITGHQHLISGR